MPNYQSFNQLEMINIRNEWFWSGVAARNRQLEDMPPTERLPQEDFDELRRVSLKEQASKGGKAPKADLLTRTIRQIVVENPTICEIVLQKQLMDTEGFDFLDRNDLKTNCVRSAKLIRYLDGRGLEKEVSVSVLKDRLSRAKKLVAQTGFREDVAIN